MKFFTNKKKTADKEIAAGRDDEKQEDQTRGSLLSTEVMRSYRRAGT